VQPVPITIKDRSGFALLLTLLIISLLMVLTLQFNSAMWSGLYASANLRDGIRLGCVARSGINCALAVLSEDASSSSSDTLQETWAQTKKLSMHSAELFENAVFQMEITDLSGKIQINRLVTKDGQYDETQKALLTRFLSLEPFQLDGEAVGNLVDAVKDWIDPDDEGTRFGAENAYYQSLEEPYACGNGPMDSLDQLRLVKGMTPALFDGKDGRPGISSHLTVHGDGRININTAGPLVLQALSDDMDEDMARDMMAYRLDEKNELTDPGWYRNIPGMGHVQIDSALIKTSSDIFEIQSTGVADAMRKQVNAIVKRGDGSSTQVMAWKAE